MDTDAQRGPHYVYAMSYPVLWKPRYCKRVLAGPLVDRPRVLRYRIPCECGFGIPAAEAMPDHADPFVSVPPKFSRSAGAVAFFLRQPAGAVAANAIGNGITLQAVISVIPVTAVTRAMVSRRLWPRSTADQAMRGFDDTRMCVCPSPW